MRCGSWPWSRHLISILIIGNEILSNQVQDHNLKVMLRQLNDASFVIDEVRIVRDDIPVISKAVRELSAKSKWLISTGGVGPTHDDITFLAYADAFEVKLEIHPELKARMHGWLGDKPMKESLLRMVRLPANAELVELGAKSWPLVKVANCFVLPGLPEVFDKKFAAVLKLLPKAPQRYSAELFTRTDETDFAASLTNVQEQFLDVEIGSYPTYDRSEYAAHVTLKGINRERVNGAFDLLKKLFNHLGSLVRAVPTQ